MAGKRAHLRAFRELDIATITDTRGRSFTVSHRPLGVGRVAYFVWHDERLIARAV